MPQIGESPRMQALKKMSAQFPAQSQQVAGGLQAARQMQLQQAAQQAPASKQAAQQIGAQQAQQAGQIQQEAAKQQQVQQTQIGQLGLQEKGRELRERQAVGQLAAQRERRGLESRIADLGEDVKQNLFDREMQFKKDELGRTQLSERQVLDWAVSKAQSEEEYKEYAQVAQQALSRELQMMESIYKKVSNQLNREFARAEQENDQASMQRITEYKNLMEQEMREKEAEVANKQTMWTEGVGTLGTVAGGVIGGIYGGPMGAAAGATAGGAIGRGLGGILSGSGLV